MAQGLMLGYLGGLEGARIAKSPFWAGLTEISCWRSFEAAWALTVELPQPSIQTILVSIWFIRRLGSFVQSESAKGDFSVVICPNVIAQGRNTDITKATSANKFSLLDVRTNYWRFVLYGLKLPPDLFARDTIESAFGGKAIVLLLDVEGEHAAGVECFVFAST